MKRIASVLLSLAMLLSLLPTAAFALEPNGFSDVNDTDYFSEAAICLEKAGILEGYPDGTFGAERTITRAEMSAIVCRMIDKESEAEKANGETAFSDVEANHWASGYINIATDEGIIIGDGNGKFRPDDDVKYEEAIKMVVCALGLADNVKVDAKDWSACYIEVANDNGITKDLIGEKGKAATRGDVAVMAYNGLKSDLEAPTASLASGRYSGARSVTLTTSAKDAEIYYTTDGTIPTEKSKKYTKAISIAKTTTLKAVALKKGAIASDVLTEKYTIKSSGGNHASSQPKEETALVNLAVNYLDMNGQEVTTGIPEDASFREVLI